MEIDPKNGSLLCDLCALCGENEFLAKETRAAKKILIQKSKDMIFLRRKPGSQELNTRHSDFSRFPASWVPN
jgi:hypothetical protein